MVMVFIDSPSFVNGAPILFYRCLKKEKTGNLSLKRVGLGALNDAGEGNIFMSIINHITDDRYSY